jgi:non-homologous end joining protein Ku
MDMVAIGRVVLTSREHIIGLEPLEKGLMGTLLRYLTKSGTRRSTSTISKT